MGTDRDRRFDRITRKTRRTVRFAIVSLTMHSTLFVATADGVTTDSPEVKELVEIGLAALEKFDKSDSSDRYGERLGGKCLVGLAFLKAGKPKHPLVKAALKACHEAASRKPDEKVPGVDRVDVYSNGLALVFLCELGARNHLRETEYFLKLMHGRQKEHGGWGYDGNSYEGHVWATGDTSQTQYAALGYWSAFRSGLRIDTNSLENLARWLVRTQDPSGCWAYQGEVSPTSQLMRQGGRLNCSMAAAGLGSVLICVDLIGAPLPSKLRKDDFAQAPADLLGELPPAVRLVTAGGELKRQPPIRISGEGVHADDLFAAVDLARKWMNENYEVNIGQYTYYYLYATERYQSFTELIEGVAEEQPKWYNDGYEYLRQNQDPEGGWYGGCGRRVDTAFAVLFLLRSTQKSIQGTLGEGQLVGGRGLPSNLARAKLRGNQVIVEQVQTRVDQMLSMIDDEDQADLDDLARDPTSLVVDVVDDASARRLQQLIRGGEPEVRLLAVRALGRTGNLDYVPSLIYALTDPDRRVVLEARDSLRFVSRRFDGFGPPDDFTDEQRYDAIEAWKQWYRPLGPNALPE